MVKCCWGLRFEAWVWSLGFGFGVFGLGFGVAGVGFGAEGVLWGSGFGVEGVFFFFTLVTGPIRSVGLKLSDTKSLCASNTSVEGVLRDYREAVDRVPH